VTSKGQVTLPKKLRDELDVRPGDTLAYEIRGGVVRLRKLRRFDAGWHAALAGTLNEWNSPEDDEAFRDL
jgi:AbrB family looped-hinge helix DNA binding protein